MSRYIDADALIRDLQERYCRPCKASGLDYNGVKCKSCQFDDEIDDIDGFADNSIDIVRCAECKHYAEHNELYINEPTTCVKHSTIGHYVVVNADDFCSYGEKRASDDLERLQANSRIVGKV